jgi:hypothetical protein
MNTPLSPNNLVVDSSRMDNNTLETTPLGFDWIDDTVSIMARICNLCGEYEMRQLGFEWLQEEAQQQQQQQQKTTKWKSNDFEVQLYRQFLFDESSVGGHED